MKITFNKPIRRASLRKSSAKSFDMHLLVSPAPLEPVAARKAGSAVRLPRKHARWLELQPLTLPLELAFWALWHCRHARPPDSTSR